MSTDEAKSKAEEAKQRGNVAYKSRDFPAAISAYEEAFSLHPDPVYLNNLGAVYFEQGEWQKCVDACEKAIEQGQAQMSDFKVIAKSYGRVGSAYLKQGNYDLAIKNLQTSLIEHRTADTLAKLKEAETAKKEADRKAYLDPELAEKAREAGNACFKGGDFAGSVKHYTEAHLRNPEDPKTLTNRAAAYSKLLALPEALKDANAAIAADRTYIKAHIRKSVVLLAMKESSQALDAIRVAEEEDDKLGSKNRNEIMAQMQKCIMEEVTERSGETDEQRLQRAMRDPEVQQIMSDPVMQQILQQSQQDPKALHSHMANPMIRNKIMKLLEAGIIRTSR